MKSLLAVLASLALSHPAFAADQSSTPPSLPAPLANKIFYVPGSSQKICQLTGEEDRQFHRPTVNQTATRFGMVSADNGYSFEHNGKLWFLFGDARPILRFHSKRNGPSDPPRVRDYNDAIAYTSATTASDCPKLEFLRNQIGAYSNPIVVDAQRRPAIRLATNESPDSGIEVGGKAYVLFRTDNPTPHSKPPGPLGFPTRSVVGVFQENLDTNTWLYLYDFSKGPNAKFIQTAIGRADDGYLYFWGAQGGDLYRKSAPFMARMRADAIGRPDGAQALEYLTGVDAGEQPRFAKLEADAAPLFHDEPNDCMGEHGVEWNRFVKRWVMLYNCLNDTPEHPRGIYMRVAQKPWGPWSVPQTIFNPIRDHGYCYFIHRAVDARNPKKCDDLAAPIREGVPGGDYGPYFISRFTSGDEAQGMSTFYYVMATWNPYTQVIMKTMIQSSP